jgi:hypothetical protein
MPEAFCIWSKEVAAPLPTPYLTSLPCTSVTCPPHTYAFHSLFLDQQTAPFQGHHKLLFLSPIGSLMRANACWWFHSVLWASQWELSFTLPFPSCFLYNPKFWLTDCSACHLLSCCFLARLIFRPWRWRQYVPPKRRLTFNGLHGVMSQKIVLFITTAVITSNPTCIFVAFLYIFTWKLPCFRKMVRK